LPGAQQSPAKTFTKSEEDKLTGILCRRRNVKLSSRLKSVSLVLRMLLIGAVVAYLGACLWLFIVQRSLIYYPPPALSSDDGATTIILPTNAARVLVSTRPKDGPGAVIYFGGNSENVSVSMPIFTSVFPDRAIYLLHYRGYGGSSGSPSEKALFADAMLLFDEVRVQHPNIDLVGRSLGSGVAVSVASQWPVARLVLITPYDSIQELAALQIPYLPVTWLLRDKFESWRYAPRVTAPTLIIAAEHDEIIPRANSELLRSRFKSGLASFKVIGGASHNSISDSPEYVQLLKGSQ
jgi:pimeloyl-ACP methyl ester carboxylesterase